MNLRGIAIAAVVAVGLPVTAQAKELSFATFVSPTSTTVTEVLEPWIEWFNANAGGDTTIKLYAGGSLGRNPVAQPKLLKDGVADMTIMVPAYYPGVYPDFDMFELPGLANSATEASTAAWSLYKDGKLGGLDDFKVVSIYTSAPYAIHSTADVKSVDDLKGLKIRAGGPVQTAVLQSLGAVPQAMSPTEMAENINRGLLDGALADWSVASSFKVMEVTTNHYNAKLGVLPFVVAMNKDTYDALPEPARKAIDESGDMLVKLQGDSFDAFEKKAIEKTRAESGQTVVEPGKEEFAKIREMTKGVRDDMVSRNGSEGIDSYEAALEKMRAE